ncbi:MAG: hypothetical protein KAI70_06345 [Candidatus Omnitrophica bacterium]|nr:hypothetical protein [Candidatus Omnitrophota bacterium]
MEAIVTVTFVIVLFAIGITYLRACKKMSEDLLNTVKFSIDTEKEGCDYRLNIQLDRPDFDSRDDLTYSDFEKSVKQIRKKDKELCGQK